MGPHLTDLRLYPGDMGGTATVYHEKNM
jgi:hypothetical protein